MTTPSRRQEAADDSLPGRSGEDALIRLLKDSFNAIELRHFVRTMYDDGIQRSLEGVDEEALAAVVVGALHRRREIDELLLEGLLVSRPRRFVEIADIAYALGLSFPAEPPRPDLKGCLKPLGSRFAQPTYYPPRKGESDARVWIESRFFLDDRRGRPLYCFLRGGTGTGRSRLAYEYVLHAGERYSGIIWVVGSGVPGDESVRTTNAEYALRQLAAYAENFGFPMGSSVDANQIDASVERLFRKWIPLLGGPFLLVIDDANMLTLSADGRGADIVTGLLPQSGLVDVLVVETSDGCGLAPSAAIVGPGLGDRVEDNVLDLGPLDDDAATRLVLNGYMKHQQWSELERAAGRQIARALGRFPLALALAARQISGKRPTRLLAQMRKEAARERPTEGDIPVDAVDSDPLLPPDLVVTRGAVDAMDQIVSAILGGYTRDAHLRQLALRVLSCVAPQQPTSISLMDDAVHQLAVNDSKGASGHASPGSVEEGVLAELAASGLIVLEVDLRFAIHPLTQATIRRYLVKSVHQSHAGQTEDRRVVLELMIRRLANRLSDTPGAYDTDASSHDPVFWHVVAGLDVLKSWPVAISPDIQDTLWRIVRHLKWDGRYWACEDIGRRLLALDDRLSAVARAHIHLDLAQCVLTTAPSNIAEALGHFDKVVELLAGHMDDEAQVLKARAATRTLKLRIRRNRGARPSEIDAYDDNIVMLKDIGGRLGHHANVWRHLAYALAARASALSKMDPPRIKEAVQGYADADKVFRTGLGASDLAPERDPEYLTLLHDRAVLILDNRLSGLETDALEDLRKFASADVPVGGMKAVYPTGHPDLQLAKQELSLFLTERKRFSEAGDLAAKVLEVEERRVPRSIDALATAHYRLANVQVAWAVDPLSDAPSQSLDRSALLRSAEYQLKVALSLLDQAPTSENERDRALYSWDRTFARHLIASLKDRSRAAPRIGNAEYRLLSDELTSHGKTGLMTSAQVRRRLDLLSIVSGGAS